jgi:hypothetical protein
VKGLFYIWDWIAHQVVKQCQDYLFYLFMNFKEYTSFSMFYKTISVAPFEMAAPSQPSFQMEEWRVLLAFERVVGRCYQRLVL